jgi:hypoxanthine phosphoribosyltransferase
MIKKQYYSWNDIQHMCVGISMQMYKDGWRPDYIVGITRGGAIPAVILSHLTGIPMVPLQVSLRDGGQCVSDLGMAEEAFGYVSPEEQTTLRSRWDISKRKNILVIDDINDTGATFNWIKKDWQGSCLPNEDSAWNSVWSKNVRFAVLTNNLSSAFDEVSYYSTEVNKSEEDVWLVYPWEQ